MGEVGFQSSVAADDRDRIPGEPLTKGQVDLSGATLATSRDEPAVDEGLAGEQFARAKDLGVAGLDLANEAMNLADRVGALLEDDVPG